MIKATVRSVPGSPSGLFPDAVGLDIHACSCDRDSHRVSSHLLPTPEIGEAVATLINANITPDQLLHLGQLLQQAALFKERYALEFIDDADEDDA